MNLNVVGNDVFDTFVLRCFHWGNSPVSQTFKTIVHQKWETCPAHNSDVSNPLQTKLSSIDSPFHALQDALNLNLAGFRNFYDLLGLLKNYPSESGQYRNFPLFWIRPLRWGNHTSTIPLLYEIHLEGVEWSETEMEAKWKKVSFEIIPYWLWNGI